MDNDKNFKINVCITRQKKKTHSSNNNSNTYENPTYEHPITTPALGN